MLKKIGGKLTERDHVGELDVDEAIIYKWI
jgi:hypothetical protein